MLPITLEKLLEYPEIKKLANGLLVIIHSEWVVSGERRMSYTTALKLVECCREYHWIKDVVSKSDTQADSTVRNLSGEFKAPILIGDKVSILYYISNIGNKSYTLKVDLAKRQTYLPQASFSLVNVFLDANGNSTNIPQFARLSLQNFSQKNSANT